MGGAGRAGRESRQRRRELPRLAAPSSQLPPQLSDGSQCVGQCGAHPAPHPPPAAARSRARRELIDSEFQEEGSLERALQLVEGAGGLEAARTLAREQGDLARAALQKLPVCSATRSLELMVDYVLERIY